MDMIADLKKLVEVNSVCKENFDTEFPFGKEVGVAVDRAIEICKKYGFRTKRKPMIAYAEVGEGKELMGILVHLDIVPAGDGWTVDPFDVTLDNGKVYGRGVTDDKGPAIAVIHAIRELINEGYNFNKRIRIIFGMSEESGEWRDIEYYKEHEEKLDFGFTPDADFPAIYGEKGIAHIEFTFDKSDTCFDVIDGGIAINMVPETCFAVINLENGEKLKITMKGKSAHGSTPEDGENAIALLFSSISVTKCTLIEFFHKFIKLEYDGASLGGFYKDDESGTITYNYGLIKTEGEKIILSADVRYPVTCDVNELIKKINTNLTESGFDKTKAVLTSDTPYVYMDKDGTVIQTLLDAYREHTGDMSEPTVIGGGTYARAMDNIVAFGPMFPGRELTEHQANEYMYLDDLKRAKEIYKTAIKKLATE